jgi:hypothetical protein
MKLIPLTQGKFAIVDDEDCDWLMTWKWYAERRGHTFYARTTLPGDAKENIYMHRMLSMYPKKGLTVDHINGNGLDNRRVNRRVCTHRINLCNRRKVGSSRYPGVNWNKNSKSWQAQIQIDHKDVCLGNYKRELDAYGAYLKAIL